MAWALLKLTTGTSCAGTQMAELQSAQPAARRPCAALLIPWGSCGLLDVEKQGRHPPPCPIPFLTLHYLTLLLLPRAGSGCGSWRAGTTRESESQRRPRRRAVPERYARDRKDDLRNTQDHRRQGTRRTGQSVLRASSRAGSAGPGAWGAAGLSLSALLSVSNLSLFHFLFSF